MGNAAVRRQIRWFRLEAGNSCLRSEGDRSALPILYTAITPETLSVVDQIAESSEIEYRWIAPPLSVRRSPNRGYRRPLLRVQCEGRARGESLPEVSRSMMPAFGISTKDGIRRRRALCGCKIWRVRDYIHRQGAVFEYTSEQTQFSRRGCRRP